MSLRGLCFDFPLPNVPSSGKRPHAQPEVVGMVPDPNRARAALLGASRSSP